MFFRINNRGVADHVGVYLGNGKFIQSPRTGEEIRISQLDNDYWQNHYIGARRVVTPKPFVNALFCTVAAPVATACSTIVHRTSHAHFSLFLLFL